jgi:hypothetical protein
VATVAAEADFAAAPTFIARRFVFHSQRALAISSWPKRLSRNRWAVMIIMTVMTGTATTPLITALQYNALIGSRGVQK